MDKDDQVAVSAIGKLEHFFQGLDKSEQHIISELVRYSLLRAAEQYAGDAGGKAAVMPRFVTGLRPTVAGTLVRTLNLPGSIVAYSPGCASRGLLEIEQAADKAK